jgi:hypothetical protein
LQRLEGHAFNQQVAGEIVELHRDVARAISHRSVYSLTSTVGRFRRRADFRAVLFHADGTTEISPRLSHADAMIYASDRGAAVNFDEANRLVADGP